MIQLHGSTLMISARSPFARRVRVALIEAGVNFDEMLVDVFKPTEELRRANPLGRVPALKTPAGEWVIDSNQILELLYRHHSPPQTPEAQAPLLARLSGLAVGVCEKTVERYLESLRPVAHQDAEVLAEFESARDGALTALEATLAGGFSFPRCQAEIDWGCALGYLDLRDSRTWRGRFKKSAAFADEVLARRAFARTAPPL